MRSGLTRQALRAHRWSLLGPAVTQTLGACVISVMVMTAEALDAARLSPAARAAVVAADLPETTTVFLGDSIYLSIVIVAVTMNLAITRQLRDIALLRTIGASPGQVRRSAAAQAAIVAMPAAVFGYVAAIPAGYAWWVLLQSNGVLPAEVGFAPSLVALPVAVGIELAASVVGAGIASVRIARISPLAALTEIAGGHRGAGRVRVTLGLALIGVGIGGSAVLCRFAPTQADDAAIFILLAACVGVGLVGPVALRAVASVLRRFARRGLPRLAVDNIDTLSRPLSGTLIPLVLAVAFATVKVAMHTTTTAVTVVADPAVDRWTDYSGTAVFVAFAAVAAMNTLITVLVGRGRDLAVLQLAGGTRRDVLLMVTVEGLIVSATALLLAAGIAVATLVPILHTGLHTWLPSIPAAVIASGFAAVGSLVAAGMLAPAAILTRRAPVAVAGAAG